MKSADGVDRLRWHSSLGTHGLQPLSLRPPKKLRITTNLRNLKTPKNPGKPFTIMRYRISRLDTKSRPNAMHDEDRWKLETCGPEA